MVENEHEVAVVGGGPTGMMVAGELALAGVDVVVLERRPDQSVAGSRAGGLHCRTIELLDQRGIADRFIERATLHRAMPFGTTTLDLGDLPTRHPYFLGIWQAEIERLLAEWLVELGVETRYGVEVTGVEQDDDRVEIAATDEHGRTTTTRARFAVGCDGGRSLVRRAAGIAFPGWEASRSNLIAEVELREQPPLGMRHDASGIHAIGPLEGDARYRIVVTEREVQSTREEPTLADLSRRLVEVFGSDFGAQSPTWISRFTDATRQAERLREGRILLAGDAAHIHYPAGGQGLSLGVQDGVNLGWKLAQVVHGTSPVELLDSYERERGPVVARVLRHTMALGALQRRDDRMDALVETVSELAVMDEPRRRLTGLASGLDVAYGDDAAHPLVGRRMPDLDLRLRAGDESGSDADSDSGEVVRVFSLLREAGWVLLVLGGDSMETTVASAPEDAKRARVVEAACVEPGPWELPVIGAVDAPEAVLVRPDGHVAWIAG